MRNVLSVVPHSPLKSPAPQAVIGRSGRGQVAVIDVARSVCRRSGEQHSDAATTWGVFALPLRICVFRSTLCMVLLHIIATEKDDAKRDLVTFYI